MHDCADMLPALLRLNDLSKFGNTPSKVQVEEAQAEYEQKMIERAFYWVKASGGASVPVSIFEKVLCTESDCAHRTWISMAT